MRNKKVERALIPFHGERLTDEAQQEALKHLKKGGKLFLLHIVDEAPTRNIRYMTGQLGEKSEVIKSFKKAQKEVQEQAAEEFSEEVKEEAAKKGVSIETIYTEGPPEEEVLKAIEEFSIDLVFVEQLRQKLDRILFGDNLNYLKEKAPCDVITVS